MNLTDFVVDLLNTEGQLTLDDLTDFLGISSFLTSMILKRLLFDEVVEKEYTTDLDGKRICYYRVASDE